MSKALVVYGSTSGNTEMVAEEIEAALSEEGWDVQLLDSAEAEAEKLTEGFDLVFFGMSTWGTDEIEFQEDFEPLYDNLEEAGLSGKAVAVFGCGDSIYDNFCGAVDLTEEKAKNCGARIVVDSLKVDGDPEEVIEEIHEFAESAGAATV